MTAPDGKTLKTTVYSPGKTAAAAPALDPAQMKVHYGNNGSLDLAWDPSSPAPDQYRVFLFGPSGNLFMGTVTPPATSVKFTTALLAQLAASPTGWRVESRRYDGGLYFGRFKANLPLPPHMFLEGFGPHAAPSGDAGIDLVPNASRTKTSDTPETASIPSILSGDIPVYSNGASLLTPLGSATVSQSMNSLTITADSNTVT